MTREEAIKILKDGNNRNECTWSEYCEAYNMAIQALEQEPCDDCIKRKYIRKMLIDIDEAICVGNGFSYEYWKEKLAELPSVQPTRIHSRWINPECQADGTFTITCEYCGAIVNTNFYSGNIDFCPNCGADMREVEKC